MSLVSKNYSVLLKLCNEVQTQTQAKKLHCFVLRTLSFQDTFLSNNLITVYAKLGNLTYANKVFEQIPHPNLFSWNIIISSYSKTGKLSEMREMFVRMPDKDGVSWNSVISGYVNYGSRRDALDVFKLMLRDGYWNVNRITFSTMLILVSSRFSVGLGKQIHGLVVKFGFESYVFVGSSLVDMYSKGGLIYDAKRVFDELTEHNVVVGNTMITALLRCGKIECSKHLFREMPDRDSISWTSMVTGLTQNGLEREAVDLFRDMRLEGLVIDQFTFGSVLTACGGLLALDQGKQIHAYIVRTDFTDNIYVGSALVDMYSKCKSIRYAEHVFMRMSRKNIISWTAMLVGYGQNGCSEEAVQVFSEMQRNGIEPDDFTLGSVISSCANLASLEEGTQFHCQALVSGLILFITVSNALITLYGKCGSIEDSHQLFSEMHIKDEVSWTALVSGYAQFGKAKETIDLFETMLLNGLKPDGVTFIAILSACSRAGHVEKGYQYFHSMVQEHNVMPILDHYTCMIDLLSRVGRLEDAKGFIERMPYRPDAVGLTTLLSSCRLHGCMEIGEWAANALCQLEPQNPASYILLSSIYAAEGKQDDVARLRKGMREKGVRKVPGYSWIKYKNKVYAFSADDQSNPYLDQIYVLLDKLSDKMINEGYIPDTSPIVQDVQETEKIKMLRHHSEKLAIAFGLIFLPPGLPIRIVKNLREATHQVAGAVTQFQEIILEYSISSKGRSPPILCEQIPGSSGKVPDADNGDTSKDLMAKGL
ncbi:hypothetical protein GIB67_038606 [Kingdonia uniflora]|uniref:DYW domain-containing protein n=1 Tax=Kingdonia uniflora TaxID=39325 RepID=A0A7J7NPK5_9MAGN|nr:hypothetical protein GIB67_038606 [Kingdonia uniflora]